MALPLSGVRVVDLTRNVAGPYMTMMLGDMGAEVIKVEPPKGDETRRIFRFPGRREDTEDLFGMFNRNKRSLVLDLKSSQDKAVLEALIARSDVFVQNSAPGAVDRLGFGYPAVSTMNPRIVYTSISGFGPDDDRKAYDGVVQAATGAMELMGAADGPPMPSGMHFADLSASLFAAFATTNALIKAMRTGEGTRIDVAMADCMLALHTGAATEYFTTGSYPRGSVANAVFRVPSDVYRTADDRYVFVIGNNEQWPRLCAALSIEELVDDPRFATNQDRVRNRDEFTAVMGNHLRSMTQAEVVERLRSANLPGAAVATLGEALDGNYAHEHQMVLEIGEPLRGGREPIRVMGVPYKMTGGQPAVRLGPPVLGEANDYVIREILARTEDVENA